MTDQLTFGGAAAELRTMVLGNGGRPLPLAVLTDDQLIQVLNWLQLGKPNETIARTIMDLWGRCTGHKWNDIIQALITLRERAFENPELLMARTEVIFDPLLENQALIRELQTAWRALNERNGTGFARKEDLEHESRLARLLTEAIANHASLQQKLGKVKGQKDEEESEDPFRGANIGQVNILYNNLAGKGMAGFIGGVMGRLEKSAKPNKKAPPPVEVEVIPS